MRLPGTSVLFTICKIYGGKKPMKRRTTLLTLLVFLLGFSFVLSACDAATEEAINEAAEQV